MGEVLVKTERGEDDWDYAPAMLDGIDPAAEGGVTVVPTSIVRGKFDVEDKGLLVGSNLAEDLRLQVGDRVLLYSGRSLQKMAQSRPRDQRGGAPGVGVHGAGDF